MGIQMNETAKDIVVNAAYVASALAAGGAFGLGAAAVMMTRKTAFGQVILGGLALAGSILATTTVAEATKARINDVLSPLVIEETFEVTTSVEEATA